MYPPDSKRREHHFVFGADSFGAAAERFARLFGTPKFILGQTVIILLWIAGNAFLLGQSRFDPYPFILLNLVFSTQAAYAAPLILLAQTRQADRDKIIADEQERHAEEIAQRILDRLDTETEGGLQVILQAINGR